MALRPEDIEHQVFKEKWKGYDPDEVDKFLDRVSERLQDLARERDRFAERVRELERQSAEAVHDEGLLKRTLVTAQKTADEAVAVARQQADELVATTREQAEQTLLEARQQSEELVTEARREAAWEREQARVEVQRVRRAVDELRRFREDYQERVRSVMADQLSYLDRAGDIPDLPGEILNLVNTPEPYQPKPEDHSDDLQVQHSEANPSEWSFQEEPSGDAL
ncbi:MAG TPA: DivIVA domain-containing protein [Egibacteraceae bacterium]|nr:DivIVA domain-containing protein [Egibacteraceae bacterium]